MNARIPMVLMSLAFAGPALAYGPEYGGTGQILVVNDTGVMMNVSAAGMHRQIAAGEHAVFFSGAGSTVVNATYAQFGRRELLESDTVFVRPHRTEVVILDRPSQANVLISNNTRFDTELLANNRVVARFQGGESEVVTLPIGNETLTMVARNGEILGSTTMRTRPFGELAWTVEMPGVDLVVINPLPIDIIVARDRGDGRLVPARGQIAYRRLEPGPIHLTATRVGGDYIDDQTVNVRYDRDMAWTVDAPRTGFVRVINDVRIPTRVIVDGRQIACLSIGETQRVELATGSHQLTVVDERGRLVENQWVDVAPYRIADLVVDGPRNNDVAYVDSYGRNDADRRPTPPLRGY
jgi:hypothetical protein